MKDVSFIFFSDVFIVAKGINYKSPQILLQGLRFNINEVIATGPNF